MASRKSELDHVPAGFARWQTALVNQAETVDAESENAFDPRDLFAAMNEAGTFEEAIAVLEKGVPSSKDLVGVAHTVTGYRLRKSDEKFKDQGIRLGVFAVVSAVTHDNEQLTYTTGAPNLIGVLWQADKHERFPLRVTITSRETPNGELISYKVHL